MTIEKNSYKVCRLDSEFTTYSREESMSSEDDEYHKRSESADNDDYDDDDDFDDCDSGAGSDDFDLLELGETGEGFCQIGDQTCSIPFELYDLPGLNDVLSVDAWNDVLSEEERFNLAKYLPDMDQETFMRTLKELFTGGNFHFGSPVNVLFDMLKGGLCEPRVALYRQGLNFFQKRQHYHLLQKHQNSLVTTFYQIGDAWHNCRGYSIEEKLRVLNIMKSQKSLMCDNMEELESDSSGREELGDGLWSKRPTDRKLRQKLDRFSGSRARPVLELPSRGSHLEPAKHGKQNPKGTLKLVGSKMAKEVARQSPPVHPGLEMKSGPFGSALALSRQNKAAGYDSGTSVWMRGQIGRYVGAEETMYEVPVGRDQNFSRLGATDKAGTFKMGKKHGSLRGEEYTGSLTDLPMSLKKDLHAYGRKTINQLPDTETLTSKPSNLSFVDGNGKRIKYPVNVRQVALEDQMKFVKNQALNMSLKGSQVDLSDGAEPFWHNKAQGEPFSVDPFSTYGKSKKWKIGPDSPDLQFSDRLFRPEYRGKPSLEKITETSMQNGGQAMAAVKGLRTFIKGEETESDSSDPIDEDEDDNPFMRSKLAFPSGFSAMKSGPKSTKAKSGKRNKKDSALDGLVHSSRNIGDFGDHSYMAERGNYSLKAEQKGKIRNIGHMDSSTAKGLEDINFLESGKFNDVDDQKQVYKLGRNDHKPSLKAYPAEKRQKGEVGLHNYAPQSHYYHDSIIDEDNDSFEARQLARETEATFRLGKKGQFIETYVDGGNERSDGQLLACSSVTKKRKLKETVTSMDGRDGNDLLVATPQQQLDDTISSKKRAKKKLEGDVGTLEKEVSELPVTEKAAEDVELNTKPQKKPFLLITPTVHTGFSFSIIHLLSAVRMAMITLLPEDSMEVGKHLEKNDGSEKPGDEGDRKEEDIKGLGLNENLDTSKSEHSGPTLPSLTVQDIVNRVGSNPGDPCILETQEPLQDLVRGVLKIFSSRSAPLGAKGWKALAYYEKSKKNWSWIGPVAHNSSDHETVEEVTSPEAWGLPHKMLVKLVDAFANWLKNAQETLQLIGSLPSPPLTLIQFNLDEKERFRDLRAQKSLTTISLSSEEVRDYFRKEEVLRYSIPDRAFSYTAIDGRKSIVAPLRRCGGKPTSKARDHFMLKRDRPPHVTILCIVRDAAARLPGSIGTRADVCTLIRDSQYIVEEVSDAQVNQVVSGALDRLHYERDPCVQFDGERKLWVYLHREREEEDFEDDGTSSTKKWKRPKKDAAEPLDSGTVTVAFHGSGEQTGIDLSSDLNVDPSFMDEDKREFVYNDCGHHTEDNIETSHGPEQLAMDHDPAMDWDGFDLNPMQENKLLCQENSTNEDFDDETFGSEN